VVAVGSWCLRDRLLFFIMPVVLPRLDLLIGNGSDAAVEQAAVAV
jgi:hypothetical protein